MPKRGASAGQAEKESRANLKCIDGVWYQPLPTMPSGSAREEPSVASGSAREEPSSGANHPWRAEKRSRFTAATAAAAPPQPVARALPSPPPAPPASRASAATAAARPVSPKRRRVTPSPSPPPLPAPPAAKGGGAAKAAGPPSLPLRPKTPSPPAPPASRASAATAAARPVSLSPSPPPPPAPPAAENVLKRKKRKKRRGGAAAAADGAGAEAVNGPPNSDALPLALNGRALIVDLGHSRLKRVQNALSLEEVDWSVVTAAQRETGAGLLLICGVPHDFGEPPKTFQEWRTISVSTDGSVLIALVHPDHWEVRHTSEGDALQLHGDRNALTIDIRRADHPWVTLVLLKLHPTTDRYTANSLKTHGVRDGIWDAIAARVGPVSNWLLAGAPEASVLSVLNRLKWHERPDVLSTGSPKHHLQCVAAGVSVGQLLSWETDVHIDEEQCLVLEIDHSATPSQKGAEQPPPTKKARGSKDSDGQTSCASAASNRSDVQSLASKHGQPSSAIPNEGTHFFHALREADESGADLPALLFMPRQAIIVSEQDGSVLVPATSRAAFERKFDVASCLMQAARKEGAWVYNADVLNDEQFASAWDWLKKLYAEKYMKNADLAQRREEQGLDRHSKAGIRKDTRGGFRAWIQQTVGGVTLARAWVMHGLTTRESIAGVLREIVARQQQAPSGVPPPTAKSHPQLAERAQTARSHWRQGRAAARSRDCGQLCYFSCSPAQQKLIEDYDSGRLERTMFQANQAFGHGRGVPTGLSLNELAVIEFHLPGHPRL